MAAYVEHVQGRQKLVKMICVDAVSVAHKRLHGLGGDCVVTE